MSSAALEIPLLIRPARVEDLPFIFSTWLWHYRASPAAKLMPDSVYFEGQHKLIEDLLVRCNVLVAVNPDDAGQIFGWVVGEHRGRVAVVHYTFVKGAFRRLGFGRELIARAVGASPQAVMYTHRPEDLRPIGWLAPEAVFNPYLSR